MLPSKCMNAFLGLVILATGLTAAPVKRSAVVDIEVRNTTKGYRGLRRLAVAPCGLHGLHGAPLMGSAWHKLKAVSTNRLLISPAGLRTLSITAESSAPG